MMRRSKTIKAEQSEWTPTEAGAAMQAEFRLADLETVRSVADPTRLRIVELLVLEPQTVKRLAATLDLPQTKLYYHVNLLEELGLIRVTATRVVSGIIEKQYGATARRYRVDEGLLSLPAPGRDDAMELVLTTLLDGVRHDARQAMAAGLFDLREDAPDTRKVTMGRMALRLTPEDAAELHRRLGDLVQEYCPSPDGAGTAPPGTQMYSLMIAFFPSFTPGDAAE